MKITAIIFILFALHVSIAVSSSKTKTTTSKTSTTTTTSTSTTNATKTKSFTNGMMGPPPGNSTSNGTMGPPSGNSTNNGTMLPPPGNGTNGTISSSSSSRLLNTKDQENEESLLPDGFLDIVYEYPSKKEDDTVSEEEMPFGENEDELPQMERDGRPLDMPPPKPRGRKERPKMRGSGNFRRSN